MQQAQGLQSEMNQDAAGPSAGWPATGTDHPPLPAAAGSAETEAAAHRPLSRLAGEKSAAETFALEKFTMETRLIELGSALAMAQQLFKSLERDFYLAAFGRYED